MAEAERLEGSTPHIKNPEPLKLLYGCMPNEVIPMVDEWAETATDALGRKYRKDGLCLLAGVASIPREYEDDFEEFAKLTIKWLQEKYGNRLKSVISHEKDEPHPHLHFYVVPKIGEKFDDIHEGYKAAHEAKAKKFKKGTQNQVYKAAMRVFQDEFSDDVGKKIGLTRLGPGRRRLTNVAWQNEKKQARFFADMKQVAKSGYKKGYKEGKEKAKVEVEKAKVEAEKIIEKARKQAEEYESLGGKFGALVTGLASSWHHPTAEAVREKEEAEARAKKAEAEAKTLVERERKKADNRVTIVANQLQKEKAKTESLEESLNKLHEKSKDLAEVVNWYEKKYKESQNHLKI